MKKKEFMNLIEDLLEEDHGSLNGSEKLDDVSWDSTTFMSFVSIVDARLGLVLAPADIVRCATINDLIDLANEKIDN